jgi:hypothetical protein
MDKSQS